MPIWQWMLGLVIAASLALISVSGYAHWREDQNLKQALDLFGNEVMLARSLNITRDQPLYLCASLDTEHCDVNWQGPLTLFTSEHPPEIGQILRQVSLPDSIQLERLTSFNNARYLAFMNGGELVYNGRFEMKSPHQQRCLSLSKTAMIKEITCPNQATAG